MQHLGAINWSVAGCRGERRVGRFLPSLAEDDARAYWLKVLDSGRPLLAACDEDQLLGAVQLDPAARPNGSHRAEVMKRTGVTSVPDLIRLVMAAAESQPSEA